MRRILIAIVLSLVLWGLSYAESTNNDSSVFYDLVVANATEAIGKTYIPSIDGNYFGSDCIGFVRYVYYQSGIDLNLLNGDGYRGVDILHNGMKEYGLVFSTNMPIPVISFSLIIPMTWIVTATGTTPCRISASFPPSVSMGRLTISISPVAVW